MYIEHIMVFERPTIEVICDIFGCPSEIEPRNPFPPLIWQITREGKARLLVYYIGDGRVEGLERQLLFSRVDERNDGDVVAISVDWLHEMLKEAAPTSAMMMLDTSFSPRPLPCANEDPLLISDALLSVRRNYQHVMRDHWNRTGNFELTATTPVQPPHCDRFDMALSDVEQPLFTKFLLKAIVEGDADKDPFGDEDRLIDLGELADYLDDRIKRAARFQWGRLQNVRSVGSRSKILASLDGRELSKANADVVKRRNRPPDQDEERETIPAPESGEKIGGGGKTKDGERDLRARCRDNPGAQDCHPCVLDPGGKDCAERCQQDQGSDLCAQNLTSSTDTRMGANAGVRDVAGVVAIVSQEEGQTDEEAGERSAACRWAAERIAPYASTLVQRIRGDIAPSCAWATDRTPLEVGPFAQIFTPIAWRLSRSTFQDAVSCLLDCGGSTPVIAEDPVDQATPPPQYEVPATRQALVDPRSLSAFNREICDRLDESLPPYIGLPRWMPGTLIVSEALRLQHGCPPPPADPTLPVPVVLAIKPPPEKETPDQPPAVVAADDSLANWPPYAVDIDLPPDTTSASPTAPGSGVKIVDSTPTGSEPPAPEPLSRNEKEFAKTTSKIRWLQSALTLDNRNPGPIDGTIGDKTEAAIQSWRRDNGRAGRTSDLTELEFQEIIVEFGKRFDQVQANAPSF